MFPGTVPRAVLEAATERESSSHDKIIILACKFCFENQVT